MALRSIKHTGKDAELAEDPVGAHVTMKFQRWELIGTVRDTERRGGHTYLYVQHFNGDWWPVIPMSSEVALIAPDYPEHEENASMLKESDKRVIRSFVNEKPASSNLLETDGVRLDKIGLGGETVAKWIGGRIAIVSTESVKSDESIIRLITSAAGPGVVDFSYARKGHRVHGHGAMGRNGRGADDGPEEDDYVMAILDRDANIGLYRIVRGGKWMGPLEKSANVDTIVHAMEQDARDHGMQYGVAVFQSDGEGTTQVGNIVNGRYQESGGYQGNGRATVVDADAARELDLYIANTFELVGAPNSIGKSIDANLKRKLASDKYDSALAPKAWQYLVDEGAKRYQKEFGSDSPIFNAATRRQVAEDFARAWEEENQLATNGSKKPSITFVRAGSVERWVPSKRSYEWRDGYSEGGNTQPWVTKREAQESARDRGARAVFKES